MTVVLVLRNIFFLSLSFSPYLCNNNGNLVIGSFSKLIFFPRSGPRPELDPDIVAELDDDFLDGEMCNPDEDGALPDNFVLMLNSENPVDEFDEDGEWEDCDEDEEIWGNGYDRKMPALEDAMEGIPPYSKFR